MHGSISSERKRYMIRMTRFSRVLCCALFIWPMIGCKEPRKASQRGESELAVWRSRVRSHMTAGAIPIRRVTSFMSRNEGTNAVFLKMPTRLSDDDEGNIYVLDSGDSKVTKFADQGQFLLQIGGPGQGPGEFSLPNLFTVINDKIIVSEGRSGRVQYFDLSGKYISSFKKFSGSYSMDADSGGRLFFVSRILGMGNPPLIDVLDDDGSLLFSFGKRPLNGEATVLNAVATDIDSEGNLLVAFRLLSILRKYSRSGDLIQEIALQDGELKKNEQYNLEMLRAQKPAREKHYSITIQSVRAAGDRYFVLVSGLPCLRILELTMNGQPANVYFWDGDPSYEARDIVVHRTKRGLVFYLLQISPDYDVDIFNIDEAGKS